MTSPLGAQVSTTETSSGLECLPTEIIEKIYVYSENLALAATSKFLHRFTSQEVVRLHFCSRVFDQSLPSAAKLPESMQTWFHTASDDSPLSQVYKLRRILLDQAWFNGSFAHRLEALTPQLQARAQSRKDEDDGLRDPDSTAWSMARKRITERHVWLSNSRPRDRLCMPERTYQGPWTDDKIELFHRLRAWYIDPAGCFTKNKYIDPSLLQAKEQAVRDDREDIVRDLDWYIQYRIPVILGLIADPAILLENWSQYAYIHNPDDPSFQFDPVTFFNGVLLSNDEGGF